MKRPHCDTQDACEAKGEGHCRRCHAYAVVEIKRQRLIADAGIDPSEVEDFRAFRAAGYTKEESAKAVIAMRRKVAA